MVWMVNSFASSLLGCILSRVGVRKLVLVLGSWCWEWLRFWTAGGERVNPPNWSCNKTACLEGQVQVTSQTCNRNASDCVAFGLHCAGDGVPTAGWEDSVIRQLQCLSHLSDVARKHYMLYALHKCRWMTITRSSRQIHVSRPLKGCQWQNAPRLFGWLVGWLAHLHSFS